MNELRPTLMPVKDFEAGYHEGQKSERKRIIDLIENIKGEISWDFEIQIQQLIQQLKSEEK
jgi:hypothetical protein